jgi:hypothetical protein
MRKPYAEVEFLDRQWLKARAKPHKVTFRKRRTP